MEYWDCLNDQALNGSALVARQRSQSRERHELLARASLNGDTP
jgi:hypothetical protein